MLFLYVLFVVSPLSYFSFILLLSGCVDVYVCVFCVNIHTYSLSPTLLVALVFHFLFASAFFYLFWIFVSIHVKVGIFSCVRIHQADTAALTQMYTVVCTQLHLHSYNRTYTQLHVRRILSSLFIC